MKLGLTYQMAFKHQLAREAFDEAFAISNRSIEAISIPGIHPGESLRYALGAEPRSLDPGKASDIFEGEVIQHLFSGLVDMTPDLGISPDLAGSWEISNDGRRVIFHLVDDIFWSDGVPITAADLEFAWKRNLHPSMYSNPARLLYDVAGGERYHKGADSDPDSVGVRALDNRTLEVRLQNRCGYLLYLLAGQSVTFPLPKHAIQRYGESWTDPDKLVGSGPFRLVEWEKSERILLERNPHYHREFRGNPDRIEIYTETYPSYLEMYERDRFDLIQLFPTDLLEGKARHPDEYVVAPRLLSSYVVLNVHLPPLDDLRVRQALAFATDQDALGDVVLGSYGLPARGGLIPPRVPGSLENVGLRFDPQQARNLLAEAGFPAGKGFPALSLLHHTYPGHISVISRWLISQWGRVLNIDLSLEEVPWGDKIRRVRSAEFALASANWVADYPDPDSFLRTNIQLFQGGWEDPAFMRLIERARRSRDQGERVQLYKAADRIILDKVPVIPI